MIRTVFTFLLVTASYAFAFRPELAGTAWFWAGVGVPYLILTAVALHKLWDEGTLLDALRPRSGDLAIGAVTAGILLAASWVARTVLAPADSPRLAWLFRIYGQVGDSETIQRSMLLTVLVLVIAAAEELVWRSMVLSELSERFGVRAGWPLTALLYGLAALPTLYTLRDPLAGANPLLFIAALGCGIVWSFLAAMTRRVPPVAVAHMVFTYFSLVQFRWPSP